MSTSENTDSAAASARRLAIQARAIPGPSHNEIAHATYRANEPFTVTLPLRIPEGSYDLRMLFFVDVVPAIVTIEHLHFAHNDDDGYRVEARNLEAHAVFGNGFPIDDAGSGAAIAVPSSPLQLVFSLRCQDIGRSVGVEIALTVAPFTAPWLNLPRTHGVFERYHAPWNRTAAASDRAAQLAEHAAESFERDWSQTNGDVVRLRDALAWMSGKTHGPPP